MPIGVMLGSAPMAARTETSDDSGSRSRQLDAHLEAHRIDEEIRDWLRPVGHDLAEDASLVKRTRDGPASLHQRLREAVSHRVAGVLVIEQRRS
jgi:hypothetical protein